MQQNFSPRRLSFRYEWELKSKYVWISDVNFHFRYSVSKAFHLIEDPVYLSFVKNERDVKDHDRLVKRLHRAKILTGILPPLEPIMSAR